MIFHRYLLYRITAVPAVSITINRTWRALYQYTLGLPGVGEESYPFILVTVT